MSNKGECTLHDPKPWYEADSLILRAIEVTGASFAELDAGVRLHVDSWDSNYADTFLISCKVGWEKYIYELTGFALARHSWTHLGAEDSFSEAVRRECGNRLVGLTLDKRIESSKNGGKASGFSEEDKKVLFALYDSWEERHPGGSVRAFYKHTLGSDNKKKANWPSERAPSVRTVSEWIRNRADASDCSSG
ncbi:hypothetical protein ABQ428_20015 [Citrobacter freundii]|uniref:hypothetical protein n=1 Tax=Enterobacteriaceae TaxID=543 RepID=UPI002075838E|nr:MULTISPECIES: hypothetical protein [Enterobacteriaceae]HDG1699508.1 hypothetical protein [Kluyvera ascorbata]MCM7571435.1 hypothetical protein [Enterobacter roggenkampii]WNY89186.1 hypothetical protein NRF19_09805 [Leclercia adecarboxylata]BDE47606.1 hypothetical protein EEGS01_00650 [Escherichia coli]HAV7808476.1 hypothetical protein [Escherichia coli]